MSSLSEPAEPRVWTGHGLTLSVTVHALQSYVRVAGELDLASAAVLTACLENQLDTGQRYAQLDLASVGFVDAAGMAALVDAHHSYLGRHGLLAITDISRQVEKLVHLLELDEDLLIASRPAVDTCRAPAGRPGRPSHLRVIT